MEEDVLGPREELIGDRYTRCSRCDQVIPREEGRLTPVGGGDVELEQVELCPQCLRELESGEGDYLPDLAEDNI